MVEASSRMIAGRARANLRDAVVAVAQERRLLAVA
jgi:hypothetical protein